MNMHAAYGTKIVYRHPERVNVEDKKTAEKHLVFGSRYTVDRTEPNVFSPKVYLQEHPHTAFSALLFDEIKKKGEKDAA